MRRSHSFDGIASVHAQGVDYGVGGCFAGLNVVRGAYRQDMLTVRSVTSQTERLCDCPMLAEAIQLSRDDDAEDIFGPGKSISIKGCRATDVADKLRGRGRLK